jgi:O-antigen ligase
VLNDAKSQLVPNLNSTYTNFIFFPCLALFTISFPLPIAYNSILSILLFVIFIIDIKNIRTNIISCIQNKRNMLLLIIFFCLFISVFYSQDKLMAKKGILAALPLLTLPISLGRIANLSLKQIDILKKLFVFVCFIASAVYLILAIIRSGLTDDSYKLQILPKNYLPYFVNKLTYHHLSPNIHAIFFSLYIAFAVLLIIFQFKKESFFSKIWQDMLVLYFLLYLIILTSATINFGLYSFLIGYIFLKFSFKKLFHYVVFFGLLITAAAITGYLLIQKYIGPYIGDGIYRFDSPSMNEKFLFYSIAVILMGAFAITIKLTIRKKYVLVLISSIVLIAISLFVYFKQFIDTKRTSPETINNITVRINYGAEAIRLIKNHPILGIGIGDKKNKLIVKTEELPPGSLPEHVFNSHNQFLDFWISAGIIPVICFLLFLINEFSKALRYKNILYLGLLYCFCLFCFTDMAMMVQRGQIFFLFFICLFEIESRKKMTESTQS